MYGERHVGEESKSEDDEAGGSQYLETPVGRKLIPNSSKRILKDHDLDQLLVY